MDTCGSCKHLKEIYCHPGNGRSSNPIFDTSRKFSCGKGPINRQFGWVCTLPEMGKFIFLDSDTGLCECHAPIIKNEEVINKTAPIRHRRNKI